MGVCAYREPSWDIHDGSYFYLNDREENWLYGCLLDYTPTSCTYTRYPNEKGSIITRSEHYTWSAHAL